MASLLFCKDGCWLSCCLQHDVDVSYGPSGCVDDRSSKRVLIKACWRNRKGNVCRIEAADLNLRHVLAGDECREPGRFVGDFKQQAVPVQAVMFAILGANGAGDLLTSRNPSVMESSDFIFLPGGCVMFIPSGSESYFSFLTHT